MTLETRLAEVVNEIAAEFGTAYSSTGKRVDLATTAKTDIVSAINEVKANADAGNFSVDPTGGIETFKNEMISGADPEFDTFQKVYNSIISDQTELSGVLTGVNNAVRYDASQSTNAEQKITANTNIGAFTTANAGDLNFDLKARFLSSIFRSA